MSKLLKAVATRHLPHIAAKMTKANGYDEVKHHTPSDLHKAKVIEAHEKKEFDGCIDDLADTGSAAAQFLKDTPKSGDATKMAALNDPEFLRGLLTGDDAGDPDSIEALDDDGDTTADEPADSDDKVTA